MKDSDIEKVTRGLVQIPMVGGTIAFGFCSVKKESKLFNKCVAEIIEDGGTNSEAVRYCNGGN